VHETVFEEQLAENTAYFTSEQPHALTGRDPVNSLLPASPQSHLEQYQDSEDSIHCILSSLTPVPPPHKSRSSLLSLLCYRLTYNLSNPNQPRFPSYGFLLKVDVG
jgi:hypothetical protein